MKHTTVIDSTREEEIIIYARDRRAEIQAIEAYLDGLNTELVGYGRGAGSYRSSPPIYIAFSLMTARSTP